MADRDTSEPRTLGPADTPPDKGRAAVPDESRRVPIEREGQYTRLDELGRGGQSTVRRAVDEFVGREVALKELSSASPDPSATNAWRRFLREARLTAQLDHPGIVAVYELARRADGTLFCSQKLIRGETLKARLAGCRSLQQRLELLSHLIDTCQALAYAHSRGVIHRDLKPSNIMIGAFGETVVLDWGLAKKRGEVDDPEAAIPPSEPDLTVHGVALGTPAYMSPEQARGELREIDERSDVFNLGAILYEVLTGRTPFAGATSHELMDQAISGRFPPVSAVCPEAPVELAAVCEHALSPDPRDRYPNAEVLAKELTAYRAGGRVAAHHYGAWELVRKFVAGHRALSAGVGAALLVLSASSVAIGYQLHVAQVNLAASLLERARAAERSFDWGRAAAYYSASRIERDSRESRWGYALARQRAPHRLFARRGPSQSAMDVGFLPGGQAVAVALEPGFVIGRDLETGRELWRFQPVAGPQRVIILGTGQVRLGIGDQQVYLDAASGRLLGSFVRGKGSPCWSASVPASVVVTVEGLVTAQPGAAAVLLSPKLDPRAPCAVSADGKQVAFRDSAGVVQLWDLERRAPIASRTVPDASDVMFTAHGVAVVRARSILVFGGPEGEFAVDIPGRGGNGIMPVRGRGNAVSPDGHLIATARLTSNQADLVDLRTKSVVSSFSYAPGAPNFTFSPSGDRLIVSGLLHGSALAAWDIRALTPSLTGEGSRVMAFQTSRTGDRFEVLHYAFASSRFEVWDVNGTRLRVGSLAARANATLSGDGRRVAVTDSTGVGVIDVETGEELWHFGCEGCFRIRLSRDGGRLLTWNEKRLELWDVAGKRSLWSESARQGKSRDSIDLSGDGRQVMWVRDSSLFLHRVAENGDSAIHLDEEIEDAKFSSDNTRIAIVTLARIGVWGADRVQPLWQVRNFSPVNQEVYWSSDDSALLVLYDSLGTALLDSGNGERFAYFPVTKPTAFATQEILLPSLRYRISRGDGRWEMWPLPPPDEGPPRESLARALSEAGLEMRGVELLDAAPPG